MVRPAPLRHSENGDYIETRLLNAGERTNPWFQESGDKVIGENELIALDTDVVGCHGYYADFSRTFHAVRQAERRAAQAVARVAMEQLTATTWTSCAPACPSATTRTEPGTSPRDTTPTATTCRRTAAA